MPGLLQGLKRQTAWTLTKIALALGLTFVVFSELGRAQATELGRHIQVAWLVRLCLRVLGVVWSSARRYWILIGGQIPFQKLLGLVVMQTALGNLVATSAGAAAYVGALKGRHQVQITSSLASLVLSRAFDL